MQIAIHPWLSIEVGDVIQLRLNSISLDCNRAPIGCSLAGWAGLKKKAGLRSEAISDLTNQSQWAGLGAELTFKTR